MNTQYKINEASLLANGLIMVSGTVVAGPQLVVGQEGGTTTSGHRVRVVVVGTGVMDPNLAPPDRQGTLVKLLEGDVGELKELTLEFGECS
jgi:hypothetical protein